MKELIKSNIGFKRWFFFWAGIVATLAYRIIIVLNNYSKLLVDVAWYIGTVGFILYFGHRFYVQKKRALLVKENKLVSAVSLAKGLKKEQRVALNYLVKSAITSKSKWNSLFILWLSILALIVGIVFDFLI